MRTCGHVLFQYTVWQSDSLRLSIPLPPVALFSTQAARDWLEELLQTEESKNSGKAETEVFGGNVF